MRYPASEKLEIIRTVEASHLPTKQTLDLLGIPDVYFGRDKAILRERERIKQRTIQQRRLQHQKQAA